MDAKKIRNGMMLLMIFALMAGSAYAASLSAASATTSSTKLTPTNVVLDYDLTRVDSNMKPGDSGLLTIVVKNVGQQAAENLILYVPGTGDISVNKQWAVGRIDPMGSKTVSTTISVSKNASIGLHTFSVRITYDGYDEDSERKNNQLTVLELPIRIYGNANFQATAEKADYYKDVTTRLVIHGTTQDGARSITATLVPGTTASASACASLIGSSKLFIGDMSKGDSFDVEYMIQPSDVGVCALSLELNYSDVSGNSLSESLPIGIEVQRYDVDFKITDVSYAGASTGSAANITVSIENVGSAVAKDVSMTLDFSTPLTAIGSSETYVGQFNSKESKDLNFQASVDSTADIKAYDIPLTVEYYDLAGVQHTLQKSIGIQVDGKPEIKVLLEKADLFTAGTKGTITVTVVNKGFAQVKFLNLKMLSTEDYDITSASEIYIGSLDSDSTDSQDYIIQIKNNVSAGNIPLRFEITYKEQNSNVDHIDPVSIELNVLSMSDYTSKQPTGSPVAILITVAGGLIGLVVAVIVIWFILKLVGAIIGFLDRKLFKRKG